jgi:hypothetical protein
VLSARVALVLSKTGAPFGSPAAKARIPCAITATTGYIGHLLITGCFCPHGETCAPLPSGCDPEVRTDYSVDSIYSVRLRSLLINDWSRYNVHCRKPVNKTGYCIGFRLIVTKDDHQRSGLTLIWLIVASHAREFEIVQSIHVTLSSRCPSSI